MTDATQPPPSADAAQPPLATDVLIIGAGPTGLMLANWLARLGAPALIIDGKAGPTRESRALIVQARSLEVYDQLGLGAEVAARGRNAEGITMWRGRQRVARLELGPIGLGRTPHPYMFGLEQSENEDILYANLRSLGGEVHWQTTLESLAQDANGITAAIRLPDGGQRTVRARYACGADGSHSTVRRGLGLAFEGTTNNQRFYVADVIADGAVDGGNLNFKLTSETFMLAFPIKGDQRYRLIGVMPEPEPGQQSPEFDALRGQIEGEMGLRVGEVRWFATYKVNHRVAAQFRQGRIFLLGDAAHVHSPVGGQGMNTGLLDAHNLAWKLAAVISGDADERLLDSYEAERRPFAQSLVRTTDRVFSIMTNPNRLWRRVRGWLVPNVIGQVARLQDRRQRGAAAKQASGRAPKPGEQASLLPSTMFGLVSQTRVSYRDSPLSKGEAGEVAGGDRLPYVPLESGSNFDALGDARPQIHVYGAPSPALRDWAARNGRFALKEFPFSAAAESAGLQRDAAYVLRPDGYVSVAQAAFDPAELEAVLREGWGWKLR